MNLELFVKEFYVVLDGLEVLGIHLKSGLKSLQEISQGTIGAGELVLEEVKLLLGSTNFDGWLWKRFRFNDLRLVVTEINFLVTLARKFLLFWFGSSGWQMDSNVLGSVNGRHWLLFAADLMNWLSNSLGNVLPWAVSARSLALSCCWDCIHSANSRSSSA